MPFCKTCCVEKKLNEFNKDRRQKDGHDYSCKTCRKEQRIKFRKQPTIIEKQKFMSHVEIYELRKKNAKYMKGYVCSVRGRANKLFHAAKRRSVEKNIEFSISMEYVTRILELGTCERTGIRFEFINEASHYSPSIDRINSSFGYTENNVKIVCRAYNLGKQHMSDQQFEEFILLAAENIKQRRQK